MKIGFEVVAPPELISSAPQDIGFDFQACQILSYDISSMLMDNAIPNLNLDILNLHNAADARGKLGIISPCLDLDSTDALVRRNSEILFLKQVEWMLHCGVSMMAAYIPMGDCVNFSRVLNRAASKMGTSMMVLVCSSSREAWNQWNQVRMMSTFSQNLQIGLILEDPLDMKIWNVEPIKYLFFAQSVFKKNKNGNPYLDQNLSHLFWKLERRGCEPIVMFDNLSSAEEMCKYANYFKFLKESEPALSLSSKITMGYEDYLQIPLQPLMDHLQSATYEAFEMDPVKYREYENAIYAALVDKMIELNDKQLVLAVVGAGRGPIVDRAISAARKIAGIQLKIYAVEKNPNAIITLSKRKLEWRDQVIVVNSDMRDWKPTEKIDILVSELLGSFGDNELSPECLDGVQNLLSASGIMIPARYDSYLVPISSPKLYESIKAYKEKKNYETPFVVKFDQVDELADPILVWTFEHPSSSLKNQKTFSNLHNERYGKLNFKIKSPSLMHGLGGYFEATLYKDVKLSILPSTHSSGMFSWFPMYFPIHQPIIVSKDSYLNVYIWRLTDTKKVWYEWMIESHSIGATPLHNPNGQSFWIGL